MAEGLSQETTQRSQPQKKSSYKNSSMTKSVYYLFLQAGNTTQKQSHHPNPNRPKTKQVKHLKTSHLVQHTLALAYE